MIDVTLGYRELKDKDGEGMLNFASYQAYT